MLALLLNNTTDVSVCDSVMISKDAMQHESRFSWNRFSNNATHCITDSLVNSHNWTVNSQQQQKIKTKQICEIYKIISNFHWNTAQRSFSLSKFISVCQSTNGVTKVQENNKPPFLGRLAINHLFQTFAKAAQFACTGSRNVGHSYFQGLCNRWIFSYQNMPKISVASNWLPFLDIYSHFKV